MWKIERISTRRAELQLVDEHGHTRTVTLRAGAALDLAALGERASEQGEPADKDAKPTSDEGKSPKRDAERPRESEAKSTSRESKPAKRDVEEPGKGESTTATKAEPEEAQEEATPGVSAKKAARKKKAKKAPKSAKAKPAEPEHDTDASASTALTWVDVEHQGRKGKSAAFGEGHWVIVPGRRAHILLYVWPDGTVRDVDAGEEQYVMDVAALYSEHGVAGHESLAAFLTELKQPDPRTRPTRSAINLAWTPASRTKGMKAYKAVIADLGRLWIEQVGGRKDYLVFWKPKGGGKLAVGLAPKLIDAKKLAVRHARKVIGVAGGRVAVNDLVWRESREDGRTVCYCSLDDGHLEMIELKTGAFALFHALDDGDWEELAVGAKKVMKRRAQAYADERALEKVEAKEVEPEPEVEAEPEPVVEAAAEESAPKQEPPPPAGDVILEEISDEEKAAIMMGSLRSLLGEIAEGA